MTILKRIVSRKNSLGNIKLSGVFVNKIYSLDTFQQGIENFGIILKGKSVENLPKVSDKFNDCFIVNNFDPEMEVVGDSLLNKNIVHFVCRTLTTPLKQENYKKLKIEEIQLTKYSVIRDRALLYAISHYLSLGLKVVFLPKSIINVSEGFFGPKYKNKYPNTGHLAIYYALQIIKPKNLWIIGLDFFKADYLFRRPHMTPILKQRAKMQRIRAVEFLHKCIEKNPNVNFKIVSCFDEFKSLPNLEVLKYAPPFQKE